MEELAEPAEQKNTVPVIDRMISRWEIPDRTEAHEIAVVLR